MQKQKDKLGLSPDVKPIFKIDQAIIIDPAGNEIDPTVEDFDTLRANTPEDLIRWFLEAYHFSDCNAKIFYSHPGEFQIDNLFQNVVKQSAATKKEIESHDENIKPFWVQMTIVAEPCDISQYNLDYWKKSYDKGYNKEYFK